MIIKKKDRKKFANGDTCIAYEYPLGEKDIDIAFVEIKERYPMTGHVYNESVKEVIYVVEGNGHLVIDGNSYTLEAGDVALLSPGEKYYFEGDFKLVIPSSPAWYPEQHRHVATV